MRVRVNETELWFDVDGPGRGPDGPRMRRRPTVQAGHGGPGGDDHSSLPAHLPRPAENGARR
jgi:proline iminopeptidase